MFQIITRVSANLPLTLTRVCKEDKPWSTIAKSNALHHEGTRHDNVIQGGKLGGEPGLTSNTPRACTEHSLVHTNCGCICVRPTQNVKYNAVFPTEGINFITHCTV